MQSQSISIQVIPEKYSAVTKWYNPPQLVEVRERSGWFIVDSITDSILWLRYLVFTIDEKKSYQLSNNISHFSLPLSLSLNIYNIYISYIDKASRSMAFSSVWNDDNPSPFASLVLKRKWTRQIGANLDSGRLGWTFNVWKSLKDTWKNTPKEQNQDDWWWLWILIDSYSLLQTGSGTARWSKPILDITSSPNQWTANNNILQPSRSQLALATASVTITVQRDYMATGIHIVTFHDRSKWEDSKLYVYFQQWNPQYFCSFHGSMDSKTLKKALENILSPTDDLIPLLQLTLAATATLLINGVFWGFRVALQICAISDLCWHLNPTCNFRIGSAPGDPATAELSASQLSRHASGNTAIHGKTKYPFIQL